MQVVTWNVNSLRQRLEHLARYVELTQPDVLCLQETKVVDKLFPHDVAEELGYTHRLIHGQKTYNGVAILSRLPMEDAVAGFTIGEADPQARLVRATIEGVRIYNCYVPNGSPVGSAKFRYKLDWLKRLKKELDADAHPDTLVCGDMNIAPDDADVYDPFEADDELLATPAERNTLKRVLGKNLKDVYRARNPFATEFSWWDYRANAFRNNHGYRIDHIYLTDTLMKRAGEVTIDRVTRTWDKPTDHAPVRVELKA